MGLRRGCEPNVSIIDGDYKANRTAGTVSLVSELFIVRLFVSLTSLCQLSRENNTRRYMTGEL